MRLILSLIFCGLLQLNAVAQSSGFSLQTRRFADAVWIRWSAQRPDLIKKQSPRGFFLHRITVSRDGKSLETEERYRLNAEPIRWDTASNLSDTLRTLKTLFFFKPDYTDDIRKNIQNKEMADLAWLQGNLMLLQDFRLALNCGMGWIDMDAKANETYLYELQPCNDTALLGSAYCGVYRQQAIPNLSLKNEKNRTVLLQIAESPDYWGYIIEKALDSGMNFKPLSAQPFVNGTKSPDLLVNDSQGLAFGQIYYRVAGIDAFGLSGPWSDTAGVFMVPEMVCPGIENLRPVGDTLLEFSWNMPDSLLPYVKKSSFSYSSSVDEVFLPLTVWKVGSFMRARWPSGWSSVYLKPSFTDINSDEYFGPVAFLQPPDSLPPPAPERLSAVCDSSGIVRIHWRSIPGAEYYRLYRANYRYVEFTDHSHLYFSDTFYSDTLDLKTLQDSVYYAVTALDSRYNESPQTKVACAVYDIIPPPPPAFLGYELTDKGFLLRWTQHRDAAYYTLYREGNQPMRVIADSAAYTDSTGVEEEHYTYHLIATDRNGNVSGSSARLSLKFPAKSEIPEVPRPICLNDSQKRHCCIFWDYPEMEGISHFRIMLKTNGRKKTMGTARADERQYCLFGYLKSEEDEIQVIAYTKNGMKSR